jgi:hypothetical protein
LQKTPWLVDCVDLPFQVLIARWHNAANASVRIDFSQSPAMKLGHHTRSPAHL